MSNFDEDDFLDDVEDEPPQNSVVVELEGSIYMVPDRLWGFSALEREDHPGVCISCDLAARLTFLNKGTDLSSARSGRFLYEVVEPSTENGLKKPTAFALDPRRIRLHAILNLHNSPRWLGRLEEKYFRVMRQHFENLVRLLGGGRHDSH